MASKRDELMKQFTARHDRPKNIPTEPRKPSRRVQPRNVPPRANLARAASGGISEDDPRWNPKTMGNKKSGGKSRERGSFRSDVTPQTKRPELRNPQQHTPNPAQREYTIRPAGPKLKWPWQKTKRGTYS